MLSSTITLAFTALTCLSGVQAHMRMSNPTPRGNVSPPVGVPDFDLVSPLDGAARPFPCGGKPAGPSVQTVAPGSTIPVSIVGGASHGGGHCQFSLSTDGKNFAVVKQVVRTCLATGPESFSVQVPDTFPAGPAVLAWSWINAIGNREYYMNCADVTVGKGSANVPGSFTAPRLLEANLPGRPTIPEMINGADDGRSLFATTGVVTVGVAGSGTVTVPPTDDNGASGSVGGSTASTTATTAIAKTPAGPVAPAPTPSHDASPPVGPSSTSSVAVPVATSKASSPCEVNGYMTCSGTGFTVCSPSGPMHLDCAPGTSCRPFGKYIQCLPTGFVRRRGGQRD
ncbi:hypothetical protein HKX48_008981 [Thoreauomyces humboldtii]|nr:hypothetical protein HKX48_008981 [Thoreauomyces humboldtii]